MDGYYDILSDHQSSFFCELSKWESISNCL